jgi:mRNA degradation ribonuclease J1/J2
MQNFILKSRINHFLKNNGKPPIVEITFLGNGGAFDYNEKNSSAVIKTANGSILIDCGSTVYTELMLKKMADEIDYVFITHCHEDHIGSLSTLIYYKHFVQNKILKIECIPSVQLKLEVYLKEVLGHTDDIFLINSNNSTLFSDLNVIVHKIDTTDYHFKDLPTSGFVFNYRKSGEDFFIIYSGDIGCPITYVIENSNKALYDCLIKNAENVFIFHDSTTVNTINCPHCNYKELENITNVFKNIYLYHHSNEEYLKLLQSINTYRTKLMSIKRTIDFELNEKLSIVKSNEVKENLKIQAKKMKEDFEYEFKGAMLKTKDLNAIGMELIIQEELNIFK